MVTYALILDTFREAMARKIFWAFLLSSTALLIFFLLVMRIDVVNGMIASVTVFGQTPHGRGGPVTADQLVRNAQAGLSVFLYTVGMGLAIFASAGLILSLIHICIGVWGRRWKNRAVNRKPSPSGKRR